LRASAALASSTPSSTSGRTHHYRWRPTIKRRHEPQRIIGELLAAEIVETGSLFHADSH
jgi:hypothetical protein